MKVLVAIESKEEIATLANYICKNNWKPETEFTILNVIEPVNTAAYMSVLPSPLLEVIAEESKKNAEILVRKFSLDLQDHYHGLKIIELIKEGKPEITITDLANKNKYDLVMLGSHARQGLDHLILGSVSEYVAKHTKCSVLIIHAKKCKHIENKTTEQKYENQKV